MTFSLSATTAPGDAHSPTYSYVPIDIIGQGTFGMVLHAKIEETGQDVAIKRVLYDRRLHNRELFLMRDVLNDARGTRKESARDRRKSATFPMPHFSAATDAPANWPPASPLSPHSSHSVTTDQSETSVDLSTGSRSGRPPVVVLRRHPNVVQLRNYYFSKDAESGENFLHLVMSYLPADMHKMKRHYFKSMAAGSDPADPKAASPTTALFPLVWTKMLLFQLCRSLAFLHARNVCHRDVKPANILVDPQTGRLQLCDFGSAKQIHHPKIEKNVSYICSRYYRAPELLFGALHYGCAVDMWSLGCIAAELLRSGGAPVFEGSTTVDQMSEIFKVLGAPSGPEMYAMNPQGAQAMQVTHAEFHPAEPLGHRGANRPASAADGRNGVPVDGHSNREPVAGSQSFADNAPVLDSNYFRCYDVLLIEALQWQRVLHRDVPPEAVDFVAQLLCFVPDKRMTAMTALEHPFFDDLFSSSLEKDGSQPSCPDSASAAPWLLPCLPNGRTMPVEMFMLTELETEMYSPKLQHRMNTEVSRISSSTASSAPNSHNA